MKKLFTLVALLACFLGAKAEWVQDYKIDYSTYSGFPFYVMGYVPEWYDGIMTDMGGNYTYTAVDGATETSDVIVKTNSGVEYYRLPNDGTWHQYFIASGIPTEIDGAYTVKAMVRASESCEVPMQMRWSWSADPSTASATIGTEWQEVEWSFTGIGGTSCDLIAQPNTAAKIEWKYLTVSHNAKESRPLEWIEQLVNGDASGEYGEVPCAQTIYKSYENEYNAISAEEIYALVKPCPIKEVDGKKTFAYTTTAVDKSQYTTNINGGDISGSYGYANQFFIVAPTPFKAGDKIKVSFEYKADQACKTSTYAQAKPSYYNYWSCLGDISFTTEWQTFSKEISVSSSQAGSNGFQSISFQLNEEIQDVNTFYFRNISVSKLKLDEGYFVAGCNTNTGLEYDLDNATQFTYDENEGLYVATVGEKDAYVSQIMISTLRGEDASFKGATLKPSGTITDDADNWMDYTEVAIAKLNLPAAGIWKIFLDTEYKKIAFKMLEGDAPIQPIEINPNPTVVNVNAVERDYKSSEQEGGTGNDWDNQLIIMANRPLAAGEETVIEFDYSSTIDATVATQNGGGDYAGQYIYWKGLGNISFTTAEQHFSQTVTVPSDANNMQAFNFNMAVIKDACTYTVKNVVWKLADNTESLINQTGADNFYVKEGAGTNPHKYGTDGISYIVNDKASSTASYNLAGQRVAKNYKGLVIKNGSKYVVK